MKAPQKCPHCGKSLADPSVPEQYADSRDLFTLALERKEPEGSNQSMWCCPFCMQEFR